LVDLDGDGRTDILSGSWPGEIYFFRRLPDGRFAAGQNLEGPDGKPINVGSASSAFAADWDGDGVLDLIVGTVLGDVYLLSRKGPAGKLVFEAGRRLAAAGRPIKVNGDAAPVAADWDGDGRLDLLVGADDGSVVWYRNGGSRRAPKLEAARTLVGPSPVGWDGDDKRRPGEWGLRVKPCVVDWDGDGRLDLLLGDRCGSCQGKPDQTAQELEEERRANDRLPELRRKWADAFRRYQKEEGARARDALRAEVQRLKDEIAAVQAIQERYRPGYQSHGFVWLFLRKPAEPKSANPRR
jgi:hypothetical protein